MRNLMLLAAVVAAVAGAARAAETAPAPAAPASPELTAALADTSAQMKYSFSALNSQYMNLFQNPTASLYTTMDILSQISRSDGAPALREACRAALSSDDLYVRLTAIMYLREIDGAEAVVPALADIYRQVTPDTVYLLTLFSLYDDRAGAAAGNELMDAVTADLKSDDPQARLKALTFLDVSGQTDYLPLVREAAASPDVAIRRLAASFLPRYVYGETGATGVRDDLVKLLKDADVEVRTYAAQGLGQVNDAAAVEPLLAALADADAGVRRAAAAALTSSFRMTPPTDKKLAKRFVTLLKAEKDPMVRVALGEAYGYAKYAGAEEPKYGTLNPNGYWAFFAGNWKEKDLDGYFAENSGPTGGG